MKKVLLIGNHEIVIYNFRLELIDALLKAENEVYIMLPNGKRVNEMIEMGCHFIDMPVKRHGINPICELNQFFKYFTAIRKVNPDMVFTYTIKPNIYGGLICSLLKIPFVSNITGLGTAVEGRGKLQNITVFLYRSALKKAQKVFFQNEENFNFFKEKRIAVDNGSLLPGSGVNLKKFAPLTYPQDSCINFIFIARIMKAKGIEEYLKTAEYIKAKYPNTFFGVLGFCEEGYEEKLKQLEARGIITYHGMVTNVENYIKDSHCTIHPSYYPEGMSNVCLESAASARPVITTTRSGCMETVRDKITGYLVEPGNTKMLIEKVEEFINLEYGQRLKMGLAARAYMEEHFDRKIVVEKYLNEI